MANKNFVIGTDLDKLTVMLDHVNSTFEGCQLFILVYLKVTEETLAARSAFAQWFPGWTTIKDKEEYFVLSFPLAIWQNIFEKILDPSNPPENKTTFINLYLFFKDNHPTIFEYIKLKHSTSMALHTKPTAACCNAYATPGDPNAAHPVEKPEPKMTLIDETTAPKAWSPDLNNGTATTQASPSANMERLKAKFNKKH